MDQPPASIPLQKPSRWNVCTADVQTGPSSSTATRPHVAFPPRAVMLEQHLFRATHRGSAIGPNVMGSGESRQKAVHGPASLTSSWPGQYGYPDGSPPVVEISASEQNVSFPELDTSSQSLPSGIEFECTQHQESVVHAIGISTEWLDASSDWRAASCPSNPASSREGESMCEVTDASLARPARA
jgi:hypothetical protein